MRPLAARAASHDGKLYGVPYSVPMMGVFYNTDIFAAQGIEVPKTYKEFVAACEKLKAAGITADRRGRRQRLGLGA